MAQSVTLSSVGTSLLVLDYVGAKTTTVFVTATSTTGTVDATVEYTLNSSARGEAPIWAAASSIHFSSATVSSSPFVMTFLTPIAGLRISSTAVSSGGMRITALQTSGG